MDDTTRPAPLDAAGGTDQLADFRIDDALEIGGLLRALIERGAIVSLSASEGTSYGCTLWSVDSRLGRIGLAVDVGAPALQRIVDADEVTAVAYLDRVKIQFELTGRMLVHGRQASVLQATLPRRIYRFQRRNSFRVRTLERTAPTLSFRHPELPDMMLALRVLDLSGNGCALYLPEDTPLVPPGVRINGASMELDAVTSLRVAMVVHHVTSVQPSAQGVRLGCELLDLSPDAQRMLQRYIDQTQKQRRMMSLD